MAIVVPVVGLLILLVGLVVLIAPEGLKQTLIRLVKSDRFYVVALVRVVLGVRRRTAQSLCGMVDRPK
jgi:hypothetical protein